MKKPFLLSLLILVIFLSHINAQVSYPYPVHSVLLTIEGKPANMAYMDIPAINNTGRTILLLHGKNFNGYYWKDLIPFLSQQYRVIVPDQIGWGRSDKPDLHYSFHLLSANTKKLLDTLGISKVYVLGHSMGGMLAARFTLMYPHTVEKLILENPIGLEDYKTFVPYQSLDNLWEKEKKATYASYRKYQESYYPVWKPEYEQYVKAQATDLGSPEFDNISLVNAITYQMIYEQPVIYELFRIQRPTLFIIGQSDRTVVGKDRLPDSLKNSFGQYPTLGKRAANLVMGSKLIELEGVGHIPHIQDLERFIAAIKSYLE